jgi:hypothetical protein
MNMLRSLSVIFKGKPRLSFHTSEFGNFYAKIPAIAASREGDACPALRKVLTAKLGCDNIREVSGEGDTWWDFTYKNVKFTCLLLVPECGGSEFYPTSCTNSSEAERATLREVTKLIADYASEETRA